jgi:aminomethyltransferase
MGYVTPGLSDAGSQVAAVVRGKPLPARVAPLPFVEQRYYRG